MRRVKLPSYCIGEEVASIWGWRRWKGKTFHTGMSFFLAWFSNHSMCKLGLKIGLVVFFCKKNIDQSNYQIFRLNNLSLCLEYTAGSARPWVMLAWLLWLTWLPTWLGYVMCLHHTRALWTELIKLEKNISKFLYTESPTCFLPSGGESLGELFL